MRIFVNARGGWTQSVTRHASLVVVTLAAALVLVVCSPSVVRGGQDDKHPLSRIRSQVQEAERDGDVGRLRAAYADDVLLVTPDFPRL